MKKRREVLVGKVGVGGNNPIRIQSMTSTDTTDVEKTVCQILSLKKAGCEIVRLAIANFNHLKALEKIKGRLLNLACDIPLVADIHFQPALALASLDFVDKVRINPGNFSSGKNEDEYREVEEKLLPLIEKCRRLKKSMRIGVNHGSLSKATLEKYGNTAEGMVRSCFDYVGICRKADFHDIILSLKASNPLLMISAHELLVKEMENFGWDYPLHLGVTEAGEGEDGRIKSAIGIGALLLQGIGDTIRVSLTEDPENEIAPCKVLRALALPNFTPLIRRQASFKASLGLWGKSLVGADFFIAGDEFIYDKKRYSLSHSEEGVSLFSNNGGSKIMVVEVVSYSRTLELIKKALPDTLCFLSFKNLDAMTTSAIAGTLILKGYCAGIVLKPEDRELGLGIFQVLGLRRHKAEFISCPGCSRTLFDLQKSVKEIKEVAGHLKGIKIAVMGCIVNGPGEMADSDFGYIGMGKGLVSLYFKNELVEKNIPEKQAKERLVELIKSKGFWRDVK